MTARRLSGLLALLVLLAGLAALCRPFLGHAPQDLPPGGTATPLPSNPTGGPAWDSGVALFARGETERAALWFRRLAQPGDAAWPQAEAVSWSATGRQDSALAALARCAAIAPLAPEALALRREVRLAEGFRLAGSGDPWRARQLAVLVLGESPRDARGRLLVGYSYGMEGATESAERTLEDLVAEQPEVEEAYPVLFECAVRRGDLAQARHWARAAERIAPASRDARRLAAELSELERSGPGVHNGHLSVRCPGVCPPDLEDAVLERAEDAWRDLSARLGFESSRPVSILIVSGATLPTGWAEAVFDGQIRLPLELALDRERSKRVLAHELAHAFLASAGGGRIPLWLNEGLAQWVSGEPSRALPAAATAIWLDSLPVRRQFIDLGSEQAELAYRYSLAVTEELMSLSGTSALRRYLEALRSGQGEASAFREAFGEDYPHLSERIRSRLPASSGL